jgi:cell division protein FtsN
MAKRRDVLMGLLFWSAMLAASAGAFTAGFYYTHGATANVPVKQPVQTGDLVRPTPRSTARPTPAATPTLAPGPIPVSFAPATAAPDVYASPAADPLAAASVAPVATPAPATPPPAAATYRVQVGGFDSREAAQRQVDDLQTQGINAVVVWDGGSYRAQLGAFKDRARALSVADEVNIRGYAVTIRH